MWLRNEDKDNGVLRSDRLVVVCDRCRPESEARGWVARLRRKLYARTGNTAVTVTVSGCVRTCPLQAGKTAVVMAGSIVGCREWAVDLDSTAEMEGIVEAVAHRREQEEQS